MDPYEIAKDLTVSLIESNGVPLQVATENKEQMPCTEANAKAVAAAFEIILDGVVKSMNTPR